MADGALCPCKKCGRSFAPDRIKKHEQICKNQAKRKPFDSSKQRALEGEYSHKQLLASKKKTVKAPPSHWREQHQDFINTIRSSKGLQQAIDSGGPLPPPPPPSINPDYIQCPYCARRFNRTAAERHINFCKEQQARLPRGKPNQAAAAKQNTRLNYQPPKLKAKAPQASPATTPASRGPQPATRGAPAGRGAAAPRGGPRGRTTGGPADVYECESIHELINEQLTVNQNENWNLSTQSQTAKSQIAIRPKSKMNMSLISQSMACLPINFVAKRSEPPIVQLGKVDLSHHLFPQNFTRSLPYLKLMACHFSNLPDYYKYLETYQGRKY